MEEILRASYSTILDQQGRKSSSPLSIQICSGESVYIHGAREQCTAHFEVLCGLRHPERGQVVIQETDLYTLEAQTAAAFRRDHIGGIPYGGGLIPEVRLIDQIVLPLRLAGMEEREMYEAVQALTSGLLPLHSLYNPPRRVTPRKQTHASLLRAAITNPDILILDGVLDGFKDTDTDILWQALTTLRPENSALVYFSSEAEPKLTFWTQKLRI